MVSASPRSRAVSPLLVLIALASFTLGLLGGGVAYARSPGEVVPHQPGTNAWPVHVVLLVAAAASAVVVRLRRGTWSWLWTPIGRKAARRCGATLRSTFQGFPAAARTIGAMILIAVLLESCARSGYQVLGALDATETVNAWGGPTYLGALLCHGLDLSLIIAACAMLLTAVLGPDPGDARTEPIPVVQPNA